MISRKASPLQPLAVIASDDADYARLGLARGAVAPWEDGARTDNRRGTYEWWYFDAHLDDGSSLVVVFMNKDLAVAQRAADTDDPDRPRPRRRAQLPETRHLPPRRAGGGTDTADVRIGENRFTGDLHTYRIQATVEEIAIDVTLVGQVPAWRPQTGYMLYGAERSTRSSPGCHRSPRAR